MGYNMKRFMMYCLLVIVTCGTASAMMKCGPQYVTSCLQPSYTSLGAEWSVSCNTSITVSGIATCVSGCSTAGDGVCGGGVIRSSTASSNYVCACKVLKPMVSAWFLSVTQPANTQTCNSTCSQYCANSLLNKEKRDAVFSAGILTE